MDKMIKINDVNKDNCNNSNININIKSNNVISDKDIDNDNGDDDDESYFKIIELSQKIFDLRNDLDKTIKEGYLSLSGSRILLSRLGTSTTLNQNGFPEFFEDTSITVLDSTIPNIQKIDNSNNKDSENDPQTLRNRFNNNANIFPTSQRKTSTSSLSKQDLTTQEEAKKQDSTKEKEKEKQNIEEKESSDRYEILIDKPMRDGFLRQKWLLRSTKQKDDIRDTITSFEKACKITVELSNIQLLLNKILSSSGSSKNALKSSAPFQ